MTLKKITLSDLKSFGKTHGLTLAVDPFHGATAYEFRKRGEIITCAGCIIGPVTSTLYTRMLQGRNSINYEVVENICSSQLSMDIFVDFVSKHLL